MTTFVKSQVAMLGATFLSTLAGSAKVATPPPTRQETSKRGLLGDFEHEVMVAVTEAEEPIYSLDVIEGLTRRLGGNFAVAQVHITLKRLVEKGFLSSSLESSPRPIRGGKARRVFRVEGKGAQALDESKTLRGSSLASSERTARKGPSNGIKGESDRGGAPAWGGTDLSAAAA